MEVGGDPRFDDGRRMGDLAPYLIIPSLRGHAARSARARSIVAARASAASRGARSSAALSSARPALPSAASARAVAASARENRSPDPNASVRYLSRLHPAHRQRLGDPAQRGDAGGPDLGDHREEVRRLHSSRFTISRTASGGSVLSFRLTAVLRPGRDSPPASGSMQPA